MAMVFNQAGTRKRHLGYHPDLEQYALASKRAKINQEKPSGLISRKRPLKEPIYEHESTKRRKDFSYFGNVQAEPVNVSRSHAEPMNTGPEQTHALVKWKNPAELYGIVPAATPDQTTVFCAPSTGSTCSNSICALQSDASQVLKNNTLADRTRAPESTQLTIWQDHRNLWKRCS